MLEIAEAAVAAALTAGARYADARVVARTRTGVSAFQGDVEHQRRNQSTGLGVRALVGDNWGFAATPNLESTAARRTGERAAAVGRASSLLPGPRVELTPAEPVTAHWESPCRLDPSAQDPGELLAGVTATMREHGADLARAFCQTWDTESWLVTSEGSRISQRIRMTGAGISATCVGEHETQRRSYPSSRGQTGTAGWELVLDLDLPGHAARVAQEARELLTAPECPAEVTDLVLGSEQMSMQVHESIGHAVELDRILGWEAARAGTSWLDLTELGSLRFGSDLLHVTADATLPGGLGSFGYDDEGTPARPVPIMDAGRWVGVLSGRDSAAAAGLSTSGGAVRADGWARLPMVRMTNVGLLPGESSLEQMINETSSGIFMDGNRSWSIDDRRLNFQFGCEVAREIRGGRLGRLLRNPTYTGVSPQFWGSLDRVGREQTIWGIPTCGKGQPGQSGYTGHHTGPCRFRSVQVGVRG